MNWWEELILSAIVGVLHTVIKNPTSYKKMLAVITEIDALATDAVTALTAAG